MEEGKMNRHCWLGPPLNGWFRAEPKGSPANVVPAGSVCVVFFGGLLERGGAENGQQPSDQLPVWIRD